MKLQEYLDKIKGKKEEISQKEKELEKSEKQLSKLKDNCKEEYSDTLEDIGFRVDEDPLVYTHIFSVEPIGNMTVNFKALNEAEQRLTKTCLDYCYHRITKHEATGIEGHIDINELDELRKSL